MQLKEAQTRWNKECTGPDIVSFCPGKTDRVDCKIHSDSQKVLRNHKMYFTRTKFVYLPVASKFSSCMLLCMLHTPMSCLQATEKMLQHFALFSVLLILQVAVLSSM